MILHLARRYEKEGLIKITKACGKYYAACIECGYGYDDIETAITCCKTSDILTSISEMMEFLRTESRRVLTEMYMKKSRFAVVAANNKTMLIWRKLQGLPEESVVFLDGKQTLDDHYRTHQIVFVGPKSKFCLSPVFNDPRVQEELALQESRLEFPCYKVMQNKDTVYLEQDVDGDFCVRKVENGKIRIYSVEDVSISTPMP